MVRILSLIAIGCSSKGDDSPGTSDTDAGTLQDPTTSEVGDTDLPPPSDTGHTGTDALPLVSWRLVSAGQHPGLLGPVAGSPCDDVEAELLYSQAELDQWAIDNGVASYLQYAVDFSGEVALGAATTCSTTNHLIEATELTNEGSGAFTAHFVVSTAEPQDDAPTIVWSVIALEGVDWTQVSAITD